MNNHPDGGPAFPQYEHTVDINAQGDPMLVKDIVGTSAKALNGMSLRDYFAAAALTGLAASAKTWDDYCGTSEPEESPEEYVARLAYYAADAMLEEREA